LQTFEKGSIKNGKTDILSLVATLTKSLWKS